MHGKTGTHSDASERLFKWRKYGKNAVRSSGSTMKEGICERKLLKNSSVSQITTSQIIFQSISNRCGARTGRKDSHQGRILPYKPTLLCIIFLTTAPAHGTSKCKNTEKEIRQTSLFYGRSMHYKLQLSFSFASTTKVTNSVLIEVSSGKIPSICIFHELPVSNGSLRFGKLPLACTDEQSNFPVHETK